MDLHLTGMFIPCGDCVLKKAKKDHVSKKVVKHSKFFGKKLFFNIGSPVTPTLGGKNYWLLVVEDSNYFSNEKSELKSVMLGLVKNLKDKYGIQVWLAYFDNSGEKWILNRLSNRKGLGLSLSKLPQVLPN